MTFLDIDDLDIFLVDIVTQYQKTAPTVATHAEECYERLPLQAYNSPPRTTRNQ